MNAAIGSNLAAKISTHNAGATASAAVDAEILQVLVGQLGKQVQADAILRKRLRVLLKPKFRQPGFNVHPNPPI